jgi:cytochrome b561
MKPMTRRTQSEAPRASARYDGFAIALHWLTVGLVLIQFALAETWELFARPTRHVMIAAHMSFGILLTAIVLLRIVWRLVPAHQIPSAVSGLVEFASKAVHYSLYAMLVAQGALGFALRWSGKEAMNFFGLQIAPMIPPASHATQELIGELHEWNGWAIVIVAAGHAAAALVHHFILRDRVLTRMLPLARIRD